MGTTTSLYFRRGHKLDLKKTEEKQIEYGFRKDQMRDLVQIMKVLQLTWAEVDRFHSAFNVLDIDRDGTVDRIEFTEAVGIEANDFSRECFHIITPKSRMNFIEFIAAITKICIANFDHLCRFAFRIVDVDCDGTLDPEEIQKVVNTIYGAEVTLKDPASRGSRHMESKTHSLTFMEVLRVADTDVDGKLSVGEFVKHARRFPQIVKPAHNLQLQLRRRIIGPYFWERRSKALSKRYDLLAAGMFETDWQEAGLGDWWGAYEQKWRHKKLDERDSLDTDFSFGDEKAHAGSSTLFPRVSSSSSSSSSVGSSGCVPGDGDGPGVVDVCCRVARGALLSRNPLRAHHPLPIHLEANVFERELFVRGIGRA